MGTVVGATVADSSPRDNFNISAPNRCKAVIVEGVGSGILIRRRNKFFHFIRISFEFFPFLIIPRFRQPQFVTVHF
jgi:hypothetical protein